MSAIDAVKDRLVRTNAEGLYLGRGARAGSLTVIPVFHDGRTFDYVTLAAASAEGTVVVEEMGDGGTVPALQLHNRGKLPLLVMEGEILSGLKQTRTLNVDVLVASESSALLPVSCIERGRWSGAPAPSTVTREKLSPRIRSAKVGAVNARLEHAPDFTSDQGLVWAKVEEALDESTIHGGTRAFTEAVTARHREIDLALNELQPAPGQTGILAVAKGRPLCLDVFDSSATLHQLWDGLIASYAVDAHGPETGELSRDVAAGRRWLKRLASAELSSMDAVAMGQTVALGGRSLTGTALVMEEIVIHLAALPHATSGARFSSPGRRARSSRESH